MPDHLNPSTPYRQFDSLILIKAKRKNSKSARVLGQITPNKLLCDARHRAHHTSLDIRDDHIKARYTYQAPVRKNEKNLPLSYSAALCGGCLHREPRHSTHMRCLFTRVLSTVISDFSERVRLRMRAWWPSDEPERACARVRSRIFLAQFAMEITQRKAALSRVCIRICTRLRAFPLLHLFFLARAP